MEIFFPRASPKLANTQNLQARLTNFQKLNPQKPQELLFEFILLSCGRKVLQKYGNIHVDLHSYQASIIWAFIWELTFTLFNIRILAKEAEVETEALKQGTSMMRLTADN